MLYRFDPASILILDRLDQVLARLDNGPALSTNPSVTTGALGPDTAAHVSTAAGGPLGEEQYSYDQLRIPSRQTTPDAILAWPIFQHRWPDNFTTDPLFDAELSDGETEDAGFRSNVSSPTGSINEEQIPALIQIFLRHVHSKNPVLDAESLSLQARHISEEGIKWDAVSCLVVLACALGCVAKPFSNEAWDSQCTSIERDSESLQHGEAYYACARKRFGLLKPGIIATQCHFLAGVYLMYTMRPLSAWQQFRSASTSYRLYLDYQSRRRTRRATVPVSTKQRSQEQSLYWSCYKSECEFRIEMNLPDSCLADVRYPDLHPLPPCTDPASPVDDRSNAGNTSLSVSKVLGRQEQENSWFYYLTEITLRRICNSVLNTFYTIDYKEWDDERIPYMARAAIEFEQQLQDWYDGLPLPLQYESDRMPSEELSWCSRARELEIRLQIYQPFLYFAIHQLHSSSCSSTVLPLAEKALFYCFTIIDALPTRHRHHGSWYATRCNVSASLLILAAVKCESVSVRSDWHSLVSYNVKKLAYWEAEAPGLPEGLQVIRSYL
ncbi:hypothetical protein BU24DRAFT_338474 [Aaosphaeria arxii CBS 175.79]|uniref:Transcription factor domain-containing protein n=1 Tax=Aaosphaeria arxii CBS 175.79 TaxID=1450172 RepID=A0A6A5Y6Q1_9PLEO|nr:uncharacterized protein BU24DRAFT_338474 [Aaosphaeria arxii CBS 175.79]KAF2020421.1 hypothetical protein BU24DRAFT_338474 [Aaosphaeria arxii CBS 175.79]